MSQNPLQKYFRQPKLSVSLPSKGRFAPPDVITGDPNNLSVFAMTGMDEIVLKTPDSLFTGESSKRNSKLLSCYTRCLASQCH